MVAILTESEIEANLLQRELEALANVGKASALKSSKGSKAKSKLSNAKEVVFAKDAATIALEDARAVILEAERVKLIQDTVAHKLELRAAIEASRVIIEEWGIPIDDSVGELADDYTLCESIEFKPDLFPPELWKYVADRTKPLVLSRWAKFPPERLAIIVEDLGHIDICKERPASLPYMKAQVFANIDAYYHVDEDNVPNVPGYEMRIHTTDEIPVVAKSYKRHTFLERIFLEMKTEDLMKRRLLEVSESSWRSPVMLVEYPERIKVFMAEHFSAVEDALMEPLHRKVILAFFRFTMNFVALNEKTVSDQHPMPNMKDCIEAFQGDTHYSCGDVADAFWTVALAAQDRHKTAFSTHRALLQWRVSVQGSKNAAVYFARMILSVFARVPGSITVYQDDIFVHTKGIKRHLEMQELSYERMRANLLVFKVSKSRLNYPRLKILGHIITSRGRAPDPEKIQAILDLAIPTGPKGIRELVGMVQYNAEYIHQLSTILAPLHDIMHDDCDVRADWRDEIHGVAFRKLKQAFTDAPLLALPVQFKTYRVFIDTCTTHGRGIGAILCQWYGSGEYDPLNTDVSGKDWRPVAYWSKLLNKSQRKYSATEAEAKGLHDSILHWAPYLKIGRFEVVVDHKALEYIFCSPNITANRRILHYALDLQGYNYRVLYKDGKEHLFADGMSRLYRYEDILDDEQEPGINFNAVTAEDIRLLAEKLSLDEEYVKALIVYHENNHTEPVLVNYATYDELTEVQDKFNTAVISARRKENSEYCARMNNAMMNDEEFMSSRDHFADDDGLSSDEYEDYDRLTPPNIEEPLTNDEKAVFMSMHETNVNSGLIDEEVNPRVLEENNRSWCRLPSIDEVGTELSDPLEVHYINLDQPTEDNDNEDCPPTHRRVHNLLYGTVSYIPLVLMSDTISTDAVYASTERPRRSGRISNYNQVVRGNLTSTDTGIVGDGSADVAIIKRTLRSITLADKGKANSKVTKPLLSKPSVGTKRVVRVSLSSSASETELGDELLSAKATTKALKDQINADKKEAKATLKRFKQDQVLENLRIAAEAKLNKERALQYELETNAVRAKELKELKAADLVRRNAEKRLAKVQAAGDVKMYKASLRDIAKEAALLDAGPQPIPKSKGIYPEYAYETPEQQDEREKGERLAIQLGSKLIGSIYRQPKDGKLFEVLTVFYDNTSRMIAAYRTPADGEVSTSDDMLAFNVVGKGGIEEAVALFNEHAGVVGSVKWPSNEHEMRLQQLGDPYLMAIIDNIEKGIKQSTPGGRDFYIPVRTNGRLGALRLLPEQREDRIAIDPFCNTATALAPSLYSAILEYYHAGLGHPGVDRMEDSMRLKYWFPNMRQHITNHVNGCLLCKLRKTDKRQGRIPTKRYPISSRAFERAHCDLCGPFQETIRGYKYLLVIRCPLTQWIEVIPLMTKSTIEVTEAIQNCILCVHGSVDTFVTDNGMEFIGKIAEAVHILVGNKHQRTSAYRPQSNGEIENLNGTLKDMISIYVKENQRDWDRYIPIIVHAYRTTVNVATGFSPFAAMYGREAKQPAEQWIEDFRTTSQVTISEYVNRLSEVLLSTWRLIGKKIRRNEESVDNREPEKRVRLFRPYSVNELFFMKSIPKRFVTDLDKKHWKLTRKLMHRYTGPHKIIQVMNPVVYKAMVNGREKMVHASKMKRDASSNKPFEIFEDDVFDFDDEYAEPEHEDINEFESELLADLPVVDVSDVIVSDVADDNNDEYLVNEYDDDEDEYENGEVIDMNGVNKEVDIDVNDDDENYSISDNEDVEAVSDTEHDIEGDEVLLVFDDDSTW